MHFSVQWSSGSLRSSLVTAGMSVVMCSQSQWQTGRLSMCAGGHCSPAVEALAGCEYVCLPMPIVLILVTHVPQHVCMFSNGRRSPPGRLLTVPIDPGSQRRGCRRCCRVLGRSSAGFSPASGWQWRRPRKRQIKHWAFLFSVIAAACSASPQGTGSKLDRGRDAHPHRT